MSVKRQVFKDLAQNFVDNVFADFTQSFTFESVVRASDGQGGFTITWETFAPVVGFVEKMSGGELVRVTSEATKIDSEEKYMFQFEFVAGLTDDMRINYNGELYNIKSIKSVQDVDVFIMVEAERGVAI